MQTYDIVMLSVLLAATIFGAWKGLAWQIASLASIFASYYVAFYYRDYVAKVLIERFDTSPVWSPFLAMLILYVGSSLGIWIAFRLVSGFIDRLKLKEFDRQLGAILGMGKGLILCVIITLFGITLLGKEQRESIYQSHSGYYIARLLVRADAVLPREIHDAVQPYIPSLEPDSQGRETNQLASPPSEALRTARRRNDEGANP